MGCAGRIIILNGPPHAGKSTIRRALLARSLEPLYAMGLESFLTRMVPPAGRADYDLRWGHANRQYLRALHATIYGFARVGCDLVVDHCLPDAAAYEHLRTLLAPFEVIWIKVTCPRELRARREQDCGRHRVTEVLGLSDEVFDGVPYDLIVAGNRPCAQVADEILAFLSKRPLAGRPLARVVPHALPERAANPGQIVLLVGPSNAGKSTLCHAVQEQSPAPWLQLGIDTMIDFLADKYIGIPKSAADVAHFEPSPEARLGEFIVPPGPSPDNPHPYMMSQWGKVGRLGCSGLVAGMRAAAELGYHVISDQILFFQDWHDELRAELGHLPVTWVRLKIDLDALREHELRRGDRLPGFAESQERQLIGNVNYDLVLDSGKLSPDEEARTILTHIGQRVAR